MDSITNNEIPNRQKNNDQKDKLGQKVKPSKKENNDQLRENDESGQGKDRDKKVRRHSSVNFNRDEVEAFIKDIKLRDEQLLDEQLLDQEERAKKRTGLNNYRRSRKCILNENVKPKKDDLDSDLIDKSKIKGSRHSGSADSKSKQDY